MGISQIAGAIVLAGLTALAHGSEWSERDKVIEEAREAMYSRDLPKLERVWTKYSDPAQKTTSGVEKIQFVQSGIWQILNLSAGDKAFFQGWDELTANWVKTYPDKPLAYIMRAKVLLTFAFYYRGTDYANTVPPQAWALYKEKATEAAKVLKNGASVADVDAGWYAEVLDVGRSLGWPKQILARITDQGLKRFPDDIRIYANSIEYLLPRWGGSAQEIDAFIKRAVGKFPLDQRAERYAWLYPYASSQYSNRLYSDSLIDWPTMKKGLMVRSRRYPTSWNRNILARNACLAMDKKTTAELMRNLVPGEDIFAWDRDNASLFDTCKNWAFEKGK